MLVLKLNRNWKDYIHDVATRLNRANSFLFKMRIYVNFNTLKSIYFAIFDSDIPYHIHNLKPHMGAKH